MSVANKDPNITFDQALEQTLLTYRNIQTSGLTEHEWYQDKNGGFYRFKGHKDQWRSSDRRNEFNEDVRQANERRLANIKRGINPFNTEDLTNIVEEFSATGVLPLEFLTVAANANDSKVDVIGYLNNLIQNKEELKAKCGNQPFEASEDLKEILRIFPQNK